VFDTWSGSWPERETITTPWQSLLISAAQAKDEASSPNVLSFPAREGASSPAKGDEPVTARTPAPDSGPPGVFEAVTLGPDGNVVRGQAASDLPEAAAYAVELAALIGEYLGLDVWSGLEVNFDSMHYLVARTTDGNVVAARATRLADVEALKKELGL
jgi:hypothetical protein